MPAKRRRRRDPAKEKNWRGAIRRHQESGLAAAKRRKDINADLARAKEGPTATVTDRHAVFEEHVTDVRIERAASRRQCRIQRDRDAASEIVVAGPRGVGVRDRVGLAAEHRQNGAARIDQSLAGVAPEPSRRRQGCRDQSVGIDFAQE